MIRTKYHGEVEINKEDIIQFEKGIPGFLDEKEFIILPLSDDQTFFVLQSVATPYVGLVAASPFSFFQNYEFKLEDSVIDELDIKTDKDVSVYIIVSVADPFEKTTANLQAPVIINNSNQKAKQIILNEGNYKIKHPLFEKG